MTSPAPEALLFLCREPYPAARGALIWLLRQAPSWLDVHVVGFDAARPGHHRLDLDDGEVEHRLYGWADVERLGLPVKMRSRTGDITFIPGNMDWLFLCFDQERPGYERIWWVEDDARFGDPWNELFDGLRDRPEGMIAPLLRTRDADPDWDWWWTVDYPADVEQVCTFHPFGSLRADALEAVRAAYLAGWKGHHETLLPSAVQHAGLGVYDPKDLYTPDTFRFRPHHRSPVPPGPVLWHPVRTDSERAARLDALERQRRTWRAANLESSEGRL